MSAFELTGQRGPTGDTGPVGPTGATGPIGPSAQFLVAHVEVNDPLGDALTTGDGKAYVIIPPLAAGAELVGIVAAVTTVSSSGPVEVRVRNVTQGVYMLTANPVIDAGEKNSSTGTAGTIDAANDDVAALDEVRVDVVQAGTGVKGLVVILTFDLP